MPIESALVVLIPEAENLVGEFRKRYDPSDAIGVPAHVTVLYPFVPPDQITPELCETLEALFREKPAFTATFMNIVRFPDLIYLAPEPAEPFRELTESVFKHFPETPPYGGAFSDIIPHLTIAQVEESERLDIIEARFKKAAGGKLPIQSTIKTVTLIENNDTHWCIRAQFALGNHQTGK